MDLKVAQQAPHHLKGNDRENFLQGIVKAILLFPRTYTVHDVIARYTGVTAHVKYFSQVLYAFRLAKLIIEVDRLHLPSECNAGTSIVVNRSADDWLLGRLGDPYTVGIETIQRIWRHTSSYSPKRHAHPSRTANLKREVTKLEEQTVHERKGLKKDTVKQLQERVEQERLLLRIEKLKHELQDIRKQRQQLKGGK